ncbi:MAG: inorganic pyrophosphatase [Myxococcota bacterium]|jgi:inorganic pyrophosphatase
MLRRVLIEIEVPRWGFIKRTPRGGVDYISPLPSPFNYGCVPGVMGRDGDPLDALVLGPRLPRGHRLTAHVHGVVWLRDAGRIDDKLVCKVGMPTAAERRAVDVFFRLYPWTKGPLNRLRGQRGATVYEGWGERER